jgi:hypothetical protein
MAGMRGTVYSYCTMKRLSLLLLAAASPVAIGSTTPSHCRAEETTYFNCSVRGGAKVVSLCGKDLDGPRSYLQYRYGAPGRTAELVYPPAKNDPAMGQSFYYDASADKDGSKVETGVWFEHGNTYYELKHVVFRGQAGQVTGSESEILMWAGIPAGAPRPLVCKQPRGGDRLSEAGPLIGAMAPKGRTWRMSPLDLHYKLREKNADKPAPAETEE